MTHTHSIRSQCHLCQKLPKSVDVHWLLCATSVSFFRHSVLPAVQCTMWRHEAMKAAKACTEQPLDDHATSLVLILPRIDDTELIFLI